MDVNEAAAAAFVRRLRSLAPEALAALAPLRPPAPARLRRLQALFDRTGERAGQLRAAWARLGLEVEAGGLDADLAHAGGAAVGYLLLHEQKGAARYRHEFYGPFEAVIPLTTLFRSA